MKLLKFEGTVAELQAAYFLFADDVSQTNESELSATPSQPTPITSAAPEKTGELTEEMAENFLKRRPFNKNQAAIIKTLLNVKDDQRLKSSELAESIGCTIDEVKGSMRAFGKRAAHTQGWPSGVTGFQRKWLGTEMSYRLAPSMHAVLKSDGLQELVSKEDGKTSFFRK